VVVIGHVDHGKSTLIGRLLYDAGALPTERVEELQRYVEDSRKRFEFAYFLDAFEEEIRDERTVDTVRVCFQGQRTYRIADVPGHREFVGNMLSGACDAALAVLVLAIDDGPRDQTRQHLFLARLLGIRQVVVALNKLDLAGFEQARFELAAAAARALVASYGFPEPLVVPLAAAQGANVCRPGTSMPWYQGPTLLGALDGVDLPPALAGPARFSVQDVYQVDGAPLVVGRVESGVLRPGMRLRFVPSGARGTLEAVRVLGGGREQAGPGDCVGLQLDATPRRGDLGGPEDDAPLAAVELEADVVLVQGELAPGQEVELRGAVSEVPARVQAVASRVDATRGLPLPGEGGITAHQAARVRFSCAPFGVEPHALVPSLGRLVVARDGLTLGVAMVR
jgi:sulfate adenylyltransferase subunit 1 (EFTu-like GTPase family)